MSGSDDFQLRVYNISTGEKITSFEAHPDYTAGYHMAAQTLVKAGRNPEAKERLTQGIASAQRTGNQHARGEMEALLMEIEE